MREAGYNRGASLTFLLILNGGAVVGLLSAGGVANKIGPRTAAIVWFAGAALFLALLSVKVSFGIYVMVFLAGCFVFSAQVLVYAFTSANHPPQIRAPALGWSAGDRKRVVSGKRVSVRVDLGGRRIINKKNHKK